MTDLRARLSAYDERERQQFSPATDVLRFTRDRSRFVDGLIAGLAASAGFDAAGMCLLAVGGYGRRELFPRSDIDLFIVHRHVPEHRLRGIVDGLLMPLMDAKLDVSYSFRDVADRRFDLGDGLMTVTTLLDMRFVAGDHRLFEDWRDDVFDPFIARRRKAYATRKIAEYRSRFGRFSGSPFILEPNIKEGIGSLRDVHYLRWLARVLLGARSLDTLLYTGMFDERRAASLAEAYRFLASLRCYMHLTHYQKREVLDFGLQKEAAAFFGYRDDDTIAEERFMRDFHRHAYTVSSAAEHAMHLYDAMLRRETRYLPRRAVDHGIYIEGRGGGELHIEPKFARESPRLLFKLFYQARHLRRPVSYGTRTLVRNLVDDVSFDSWDEEMRRLFFATIAPDRPNVGDVMMQMYDSGFLPAVIPEFRRVLHKMQFDAYHVYTVDIHSIMAVNQLGAFFAQDLHGIRGRVRKPWLLAFAVLLHDIGKGEGGTGHARKGAELSSAITGRIGFDPDDAAMVEYLVRSHLLLSNIAMHRDISDASFLRRVYEGDIGTLDKLNYLYFLTLADTMSVGEGVWNEWKSHLLHTLYRNLEAIGLESVTAEPASPVLRMRAAQEMSELWKRLESSDLDHLLYLLPSLPESYLVSNDTATIVRHLAVEDRFVRSGRPLVVEVVPHEQEKYSEILIATKDRHGLFSQMAGAMTLAGFNILAAAANTRTTGNVLNSITVDLGKRAYEVDPLMHEQLENILERVIVQGEDLTERVTAKARRYHRKSHFRKKTDVFFDNASSDDCTIIDVFAPDHMGLLFEITSALSTLGLDICFSRIATYGERAVDVFYVQRDGCKITDGKELDVIKECIMKAIGG